MPFGYLFSHRNIKRSRRRAPPRSFQMLENRYVLSSAPVIDAFNASVGAGNTISISGHVADYDPNAGALQVALSGPVQANVAADSAGNFSYEGTASALGNEQAIATDAGTGLASAAAQTPIANNAPQITFSVQETGDGTNVVVSGSVSDESPAGLAVNFAGVVSGSAITDSTGSFVLNTTASALGTVTATTADVWGVSSPSVDAALTDSGPTVTVSCDQSDPSGLVTFSGQVSDGVPGGAVVQFSGSVTGTVTTDSSGCFSLTVQSPPPGDVSVEATNVWGQSSAPTSVTVVANPAAATLIVSDLSAYATANSDPNLSTWYLSGVISGPVGTYGIQLSGLVDLTEPVTTTPDAASAESSDFTISFALPIGASGEIAVVASNSLGTSSDPVYYIITSV